MNEVLLLLLIACTLITFFSLNKKMVAADFIHQQLTRDREKDTPFNGITRVIYAAIPQKTKEKYARLWSVTATWSTSSKNQDDQMVLMYHQSKGAVGVHSQAVENYALPKNDGGNYREDVCVISSISDMHYRHALFSLDGLE
ncbi:MAG TPA: hypothetical protein VFV68_02505 [Agriterribacter sp.]|nr:hypothetical protein [Agriterribacter sp.]